MTGDRIAKIMRATRWVALGTTLTLWALATGSIGFQVYKNLDALRSIDANQNDRHLQRLSMEHERLFYLASQNVPTDQIDGVVADIMTSIDLIKQQNVIDNKFFAVAHWETIEWHSTDPCWSREQQHKKF